MNPFAELERLGLKLPTPARPEGMYIPGVQVGDLYYTAGEGAVVDGEPIVTGKVGAEVTLEQAREAARVSMLNLLAILDDQLESLVRVKRIVKVLGFVASADGFTQQPVVIDGASELLIQVFGDAGRHARSAIGVAELPQGSPVEIELVCQVER